MQLIHKIKKYLLKKRIHGSSPVKLVAGAGPTRFDGWIATEISEFDITKESDYAYLFGTEKKIDNILIEHVVEHLEQDQFIQFLSIAKKYLAPHGVIRIAVPDAYHPSSYIRQLTGKNGTEHGADDHKYHYSIDDLEHIASESGYVIRKLEYFDRDGCFHASDFDYDNGYISRCLKNYAGRFTSDKDEYQKMINGVPEKLRDQFVKKNIYYTSLLVDLCNE
jgi:predicted SAM-dependent methyltransferase